MLVAKAESGAAHINAKRDNAFIWGLQGWNGQTIGTEAV